MRDQIRQQLRLKVDRFVASHSNDSPIRSTSVSSPRIWMTSDESAVDDSGFTPGWFEAAADRRRSNRKNLKLAFSLLSLVFVLPMSVALLGAGVFAVDMSSAGRLVMIGTGMVTTACALVYAAWT